MPPWCAMNWLKSFVWASFRSEISMLMSRWMAGSCHSAPVLWFWAFLTRPDPHSIGSLGLFFDKFKTQQRTYECLTCKMPCDCCICVLAVLSEYQINFHARSCFHPVFSQFWNSDRSHPLLQDEVTHWQWTHPAFNLLSVVCLFILFQFSTHIDYHAYNSNAAFAPLAHLE